MSCLEDADGLERGPGRSAEQQSLEAGAVFGDVDERSQEIRGGRERDSALWLVAGDAEAIRHVDLLGRLGEQPALAASRFADDDCCGGFVAGTARRGLDNGPQLCCTAHE